MKREKRGEKIKAAYAGTWSILMMLLLSWHPTHLHTGQINNLPFIFEKLIFNRSLFYSMYFTGHTIIPKKTLIFWRAPKWRGTHFLPMKRPCARRGWFSWSWKSQLPPHMDTNSLSYTNNSRFAESFPKRGAKGCQNFQLSTRPYTFSEPGEHQRTKTGHKKERGRIATTLKATAAKPQLMLIFLVPKMMLEHWKGFKWWKELKH